jgi:hypothetical protein
VVKWRNLFVFTVLLSIVLMSFSRTQGQSLNCKEVYSSTVGFGSFRDYNREIIPQDAYLFHDTSEWLDFKKKYLWDLNIPNPSDGEKFIVIQKGYSSGNAHAVKYIRINDNKVFVYVKKVWGGGGLINAAIPKSYFKDIIIVTVDGKLISGDEEVILKSSIF